MVWALFRAITSSVVCIGVSAPKLVVWIVHWPSGYYRVGM